MKIFFLTLLPVIMMFAGHRTALAQESDLKLQYESSITGGTGSTLPFWLHSNRYGEVDSAGTNWINRISIQKTIVKNDRFRLATGGSIVGRLSPRSALYFPELYLQAESFGFLLQAGRFPQTLGLGSEELSAGSMMVSRNATPVPGISLSTPEYLDVPGTNGHVQVKGLFTHKWLEKDRFVQNSFLHQKYAYLRVNIGPFSGTGGMIHNVVWGGTHPTIGELPRTFNDFLRVVAGMAASEESGAPGSDISNALGNSVAAYDFMFQFENDRLRLQATRLFYLEDRVSTRFRSPWDGSWSLSLDFKDRLGLLDRITYEHYNTKRQDALPGQPLGRAGYYNNGIYRSGWTYEDRVLGNPLLLFDAGRNRVYNNILLAHHLGLGGNLYNRLTYNMLLTWSRNYGDEYLPGEHRSQFSGFLDLRYTLPGMEGITVFASIAIDSGELYEDSIGLQIGLWVWKF